MGIEGPLSNQELDNTGSSHSLLRNYILSCRMWDSRCEGLGVGFKLVPKFSDVSWRFGVWGSMHHSYGRMPHLVILSNVLGDWFASSVWMNLWIYWICAGEDLPPLQLNDEVFKSIGQLYDCLLTEVNERCKKNLLLAKRLNASLAFFCYDLLSIVEPRQVFQLVSQSKHLHALSFWDTIM
jgi:hypothetical protein